MLINSFPTRQIFTNADKAHASRVLNRLGLEDCFDGIICFETINTPDQPATSPNSNCPDENDVSADKAAVIDDPSEVSGTMSALPMTPVVCKPFEDAYKQVFKIAGINPRRTVIPNLPLPIHSHYFSPDSDSYSVIFLSSQLFFDDSVRNLQTGKQMGLHTVLVTCDPNQYQFFQSSPEHNNNFPVITGWYLSSHERGGPCTREHTQHEGSLA